MAAHQFHILHPSTAAHGQAHALPASIQRMHRDMVLGRSRNIFLSLSLGSYWVFFGLTQGCLKSGCLFSIKYYSPNKTRCQFEDCFRLSVLSCAQHVSLFDSYLLSQLCLQPGFCSKCFQIFASLDCSLGTKSRELKLLLFL